MPAKPWVTFRRPDPERQYLVLLFELPLKRFRDLGAFLLSTWRIQGQLRRTLGLLGYSLLARILQKQLWTLSVWDGEAALPEGTCRSTTGHQLTPSVSVRLIRPWMRCGSSWGVAIFHLRLFGV